MKQRGNAALSSAVIVAIGMSLVLPARSAIGEDLSTVDVEGFVYEHPGRPIAIDYATQRLYASGGDPTAFNAISEYDLTRPYGEMFVRTAKLDFGVSTVPFRQEFVALDSKNRRLFMMEQPGENLGMQQVTSCRRGPMECVIIHALDLDTLTLRDEWNLTRLLPGFWPVSLTYSSTDRRIYLVGMAHGLVEFVAADIRVPVTGALVAAIDVDAPSDSDAAVAWRRPLRSCLIPQTQSGGIYRSLHLPALYLACIRVDATVGAAQYPGRVGVLRLIIDPKARGVDAVTSPAFREEFFRAAGAVTNKFYFVARSAFDSATDRFALVSAADNTAGVWLFDGMRSIWAGFLPNTGGDNSSVGIDPVSGVLAVKESVSAVTFTDGRSTPVPLGEQWSLPDGIHTSGENMFFDGHGRVFWHSSDRLISARVPPVPATPVEVPPGDEITADVPEGPHTYTTYAGGTSGFGARAMMIGGVSGAGSGIWPPLLTEINIEGTVGTAPVMGPGDRGVRLGRLAADVRGSGVQVETQALAPDDRTADDERTARNLDLYSETARARRSLAERTDQDPETFGALLEELSTLPEQVHRPLGQTAWPWPKAFCLDAGGEPSAEDPPSPGGRASVRCDLEQGQGRARAEGPGIRLGDLVSIADAGIVSSIQRQPGRVLTTTSAWSRGVQVNLEGTGTLRIGEVSLNVMTESGGRTGTAKINWSRSVGGVEVRDQSGKLLYGCEVCVDSTVAGHVNELLGTDVRFTVGEPEVIQTPKGAYARFHEPFDQYVNDLVMNNDPSEAFPALQLEIYHDVRDKSRTLIQLAAIDASTLYGITSDESRGVAPGNESSVPCPGCAAGVPSSMSVPSLSSFPDPVDPPAGGGGGVTPMPWIATLPVKIVEQALFLARSPAEAASMILVLSLAAGFVALSIRRRALGGVL